MRIGWLLLAAIVALLVYSSAFTVSETEYAAKFRLGKIVATDFEPGLHWKFPIVNNVRKFERRILSLDAAPERFITLEKKDVIVDSFVKWRINNVRDFYTATSGDQTRLRSRLSQIIADGLRTEFAKRTLKEVVSTEREEIMASLAVTANQTAQSLGIEIVDVRIKRIDLPEEVSSSVFRRMRAERAEVANELRSEGREQAEIIEATAEREVQVLIAEAQRDAERIRGEGDAESARIYALAYEQDPEFYSFFRSLQAYRQSFQGNRDLMLLNTESEFFDFFSSQQGRNEEP
ncbi:MAG: protease modulator HflC [Xanthomonadales bacterium]|nr:protease modulator HflC [Xanthomonadales bacterium]